MAGGHRGLRDRPAAGHCVQNRHAGRYRRRSDRRPPHDQHRPAGRLACGVAARRGFDVTRPTAWSAEGLLPYLPPEAQDRLFDNITALSAPGSRLATEHVPDPNAFSDERLQRISERWQSFGFNLNAADLFYRGERNVVADYLTTHNWEVTAHSAKELYARNGFEFPENELNAAFADMSYVAATLK